MLEANQMTLQGITDSRQKRWNIRDLANTMSRIPHDTDSLTWYRHTHRFLGQLERLMKCLQPHASRL